MVCTAKASTEPTVGEASSGGGLPHHPRESHGHGAVPETPQVRPGRGGGRGGGGTWSDGLQQKGHGRWEAENGGQVGRVQQQPCLLRQGALGGGGSGAQRGPRSPDKGLPGERLSRPGHSPPRGATHSLKPRGAGGTLTHRRAWGGAGLRPGQGVRALLTTARRFSTWKAATAKALAPEDGRPRGRSGSGEPRPHPRPSSVPSSPMTRHRAGQL